MFLQQPVLSVLLANAAHDIEMADGRIARMAFYDTGRAGMRRPDGSVLSGSWHIQEDGYSVEWENGPSARWRLSADAGRIAYVDPQGTERGVVRAISFNQTEGSASGLDA